MSLQLKRYELNIGDKDIETSAVEDIATFESLNVYKVVPLEFGGYLAFDTDFVHCYKKRIRTRVVSKKLRKPMKIKDICQIDKYDPETKLTQSGSSIMRYLFATENGELYMLAFYLDSLHLV